MNLNQTWMLVTCFSILTACSEALKRPPLDVQGHRGCRGLYPENSLPAFEAAALQYRVHTLELDVVITGDSQVLVSHEPWFSAEFCRDPQGRDIDKAEELNWNLFQMTYAQIKTWDCGSRPHPRFVQQQKMAVHKPLLSEVFSHLDKVCPRPLRYNIELKRVEGQPEYYPDAATFVRLVLAQVRAYHKTDLVTLQSFDLATLREIRRQAPEISLAYLVEEPTDFEANLQALGFVPPIYSPYFKLVDDKLRRQTRDKGMALIPWTVNEPEDIKRMISLGVDGLITDYPNRLEPEYLYKD